MRNIRRNFTLILPNRYDYFYDMSFSSYLYFCFSITTAGPICIDAESMTVMKLQKT